MFQLSLYSLRSAIDAPINLMIIWSISLSQESMSHVCFKRQSDVMYSCEDVHVRTACSAEIDTISFLITKRKIHVSLQTLSRSKNNGYINEVNLKTPEECFSAISDV